MKTTLFLGALAVTFAMAGAGAAEPPKNAPAQVLFAHVATTHHTKRVGAVDMFYRAAGAPDAPVLLLLHGFPSSSHMFRNLIPLLATKYRVIAPDLPGFGSTQVAPGGEYTYSFDAMAQSVLGLTEALALKRYAMYVFDYGAPVGFRMATQHPERVTALITQNGNAYEAGLTDAWKPLQAYWADPTESNRTPLRSILKRETTTWQYHHGTPAERLARIGPDSIAHDQAILDRDPELQLDLFYDYRTNVAAYPKWQAYLREHQPPVLAIWGKNDPFFGPEGAKAFKKDVPGAVVELIDAGHFPLETHLHHIASRIHAFLASLPLR